MKLIGGGEMKVNKLLTSSCEKVLKKLPEDSLDCVIANTPDLNQYTPKIRKQLFSRLTDGGVLIVVAPNTYGDGGLSCLLFEIPLRFSRDGFKLQEKVIYYNNTFPSPYKLACGLTVKSHCDQHRTFYVFSKGTPKTFTPVFESNVWTYDEEDIGNDLPDQIVEDIIVTWTKKGNLIYVPFGDSGYITKTIKIRERKYIVSGLEEDSLNLINKVINAPVISFDISTSAKPVKRITTPKFDSSFSLSEYKDIAISSDYYYSLPRKKQKETLKKIFLYYRRKGFPYPTLTDSQLDAEMLKLKKLDTKTLLAAQNNVIRRNKVGLALANYYMPHMYEVKCHNFYTPMQSFSDTKLFLRAILKSLEFNGGISDGSIRSALKWVTGTQMVSNFRPSVAKYIYDTYAGSGRVLDFSCGYGGRLIGAISSNRVSLYHGADPCVPTYKGLLRIKNDYGDGKAIVIKNEPFEDAKFKKLFYDVAFSSPPYFHQEEYGDEEGQSFKRYPTKEKWRDGFLKPLIQKCYHYIKDDGYFILNIANIATYKTFEEDAIKIAQKVGFTLIKTYLMSLSRLFTGSAFKFEPIYVFQKSKHVRKKYVL